jgi:peptidoglycan/xylan/chitin deacetylase (PgdA/CDA1 family)
MADMRKSRTDTRRPLPRRKGGESLPETTTRTLAILGFHKVGVPPPGSWETWYNIPEAIFVGYLTYLRENGWQVLDVAALLRGLAAPETLPERAAVLTFDDGYRTIVECALPRLCEFGYPGVLFIPTDFIGGYNDFDANTRWPREAICGWAELRELERGGISVQSHGASHRAFSELDLKAVETELVRSRAVLEDGLGKPVEVFSYPYGDAGADREAVRDALRRAGYRAACLYGDGPNFLPIVDPYRLERLAMGPDTDLQAELNRTPPNRP